MTVVCIEERVPTSFLKRFFFAYFPGPIRIDAVSCEDLALFRVRRLWPGGVSLGEVVAMVLLMTKMDAFEITIATERAALNLFEALGRILQPPFLRFAGYRPLTTRERACQFDDSSRNISAAGHEEQGD